MLDSLDSIIFPTAPQQPRPILIRFTRGTGIDGAIVRYATWSNYAHVGFLLPDDTILDATPEFGVSLRHDYDDATTRYYKPALAPRAIDKAVQWAASQVGKPYDWSAIYGIIFRRDWHKPTAWFCSELVQNGSEVGGDPFLVDGGQIDRITPRDLELSPKLVSYPLIRSVNTVLVPTKVTGTTLKTPNSST
jgi:uncharacterized protein YycO